jgi:hypothetical protein
MSKDREKVLWYNPKSEKKSVQQTQTNKSSQFEIKRKENDQQQQKFCVKKRRKKKFHSATENKRKKFDEIK